MREPRGESLARTNETMADEKPKKTQKAPTATTRAPRKRAASPRADEAAPRDVTSVNDGFRSSDTPVAIEQSSEVGRPASVDDDEIRRQAYALYLSRGGGDGSDLSDWLEAERIVRLRRGGSESADRNQR